MKKPVLLGLICELSLAVLALVCLIIAAVFGKVALVIASAVVMLALLYIAGGFLMEHYKPGSTYFDWAVWFWNVFCVEWTWNIFCKQWVWNIFCVEWTWKTFCKAWTWETFCKAWVWNTFCKAWVWETFCKEWVWQIFCKKFMWETVHLDKFYHVFCVEWVWQTFCKAWVWNTFCKAWVWETFCKVWVWQIFCKKFMWDTVHLDKFWSTVCVAWIWNTFFVKWIWKGLRLNLVWQSFFVNILYKKFDKWKAWLYLSPALVLLAIFTVWPLINTVKMAFTSYYDPEAVVFKTDENGDYIFDDETGKKEILHKGKWYGYSVAKDVGNKTLAEKGQYDKMVEFKFSFNNFKEVVAYDGFGTVMKNTIILCIATVPLSTFLALLIAVCLNAIKPLRRFLQTIFFMPYVTNSIAIGMVFAAMFNIVGINPSSLQDSESLGIINWFLQKLGSDPINWINIRSTYWANIIVMIIYIVWNALPFKILILLGGLQSVNKQYYEAAKIDATPRWRVFTRITVPLLSPMITYVVITGFIGGFKEYTSIVGIFGDGMQPPGASVGTPRLQTMVGYIYDKLGNSEGTASAAAIILFLLIFVVTLINLRISKKNTHY